MSLEAALTDNTAAIRELIEVTKTANAGREAALAAAQSMQGEKPPGAARKAKEKDDAPKAPAGPPSVDDVRSTFGAWLGVEDEAVREERKALAKLILAKLGGVAKATDLAEGNRAQAIAWVKTLADGGSVPELEPEKEEEGLI